MEGLKCVSMVLGAPSVMISGIMLMLLWCVSSWDTPHMVSCFDQFTAFVDLGGIHLNLIHDLNLIPLLG